MIIKVLIRCGVLLIVALHSAPVNAQEPGGASANQQCTAPIYRGKEMDRKAKIRAKPDPDYDKTDRRRYPRGVVTLHAILCGSGEVTDIKIKSGPADSVNVRAVEAARKIRFEPAEKDGEKVSTIVVLLYRVD
jgi:TonB family protein